jgi:hypothetical protein
MEVSGTSAGGPASASTTGSGVVEASFSVSSTSSSSSSLSSVINSTDAAHERMDSFMGQMG